MLTGVYEAWRQTARQSVKDKPIEAERGIVSVDGPSELRAGVSALLARRQGLRRQRRRPLAVEHIQSVRAVFAFIL